MAARKSTHQNQPGGFDLPFASGQLSARAGVVCLLFAAIFVILVVRIFFLTAVVSDEYAKEGHESRQDTITLSARRGTIYDRNGNVLACSVDAKTICANPQLIDDPKGTASILAAILHTDSSDIELRLSNKDSSFAYVARKVAVATAEQIEVLDLKGIYLLDDTRREYPYGESGGTVIGFVNVDGEGVSGLEAEYDDILRGTDGESKVEYGVSYGNKQYDDQGREIIGENSYDENGVKYGEYNALILSDENVTTPAVDGQDIMVSIDIDMQIQLETILKAWKENLKVETQAMLMDATTGEIYAAGSTPTLNPSDTSKIEEGATELTLVSSAYEPGSVFKTVSALSVLEDKGMTPDETIDCPSSIEADGYEVSDAHARGDVEYSFREVIQYSSNVGISLITEQKGSFQKLYERILEYGLNTTTGIDYPGEATGYLSNFDTWSKIQGYNVTFGQGISVTPLQITRVYGALLNKGVACTPHFLIAYPRTGETPTYPTQEIIHSQQTITDMTSMLQSVVSDGTAKAAQIDGYEPAGKTGTAEVANEEGGYREDIYNISFVGFLPNTTSNLVCFTGAIEQPAEGNVSGMFKDIMTYAIQRYGIVPTQ